ncbi:hypothetical protein OHB41_20525 [Streptomyces sp. NBC_01571]|uniref:hypothetical protein n=1 Tax=Streptomyces sp. NBC_01571 TaxID=2975883 RepID=UPI0022525D30|nr:hypothetical protein [Streptomyces sp. NBC_01571]MCX4575531.1 hypothetical protein [Streptomyces sp. NBC_01571]
MPTRDGPCPAASRGPETFERDVAALEIRLLRPPRRGERERAVAGVFRPLRQIIGSVNETWNPPVQRRGAARVA